MEKMENNSILKVMYYKNVEVNTKKSIGFLSIIEFVFTSTFFLYLLLIFFNSLTAGNPQYRMS